MTEPAKYEAPCTPDEETRLSVASMVSLTCAFQLRPALSVVYMAPAEVESSAWPGQGKVAARAQGR